MRRREHALARGCPSPAGLAGRLADAPLPPPVGLVGDRARWLAALQRGAGNAAVAGLVRVQAARPASLATIATLGADPSAGTTAHRAGTPAAQAPPGGFAFIQSQSSTPVIGAIAGITLIKNSGGFTAPVYARDARPVRDEQWNLTRWYPYVDPTPSPQDAVHNCYFPAAGDHDHLGSQRIGGRSWRHVVRVTASDSARIGVGEREHLNDALLAFQLVYAAIAAAINDVAATTLPARASRPAAIAVADAALAARLPAGLTTNPADWPGVLDRLLHGSQTRDTSGWHNTTFGPSFRERGHGLIVHPLSLTGLNLGVPSSQIIHL